MPKFKQPKIPRCPDFRDVRGQLTDLGRQLREARLEWLVKLWRAAENLNGKPLVRFIEKAADAAIDAGLYARGYDLAWAIVRRFHTFDTTGGGMEGWHCWLKRRGIYPPDFVKRYFSQRGREFWDDLFKKKKLA